jgi:hypothetical protein
LAAFKTPLTIGIALLALPLASRSNAAKQESENKKVERLY